MTIEDNGRIGRLLSPMEPPLANPTNTPPRGWDTTWESEMEPEWRFGAPAPWTLQPCGCFLRRPDYEAVLCAAHLAELNSDRSTS